MFRRFLYSVQRFMFGRNGSDYLNLALFSGAFVSNLLSVLFYRLGLHGQFILLLLSAILQLGSYALFGWAFFRTFSRNLTARRRENQRFVQFFRKLTDRNNRYYRCPQCKQTVRVPRGRGKICIKCPKCGEKFVRKS